MKKAIGQTVRDLKREVNKKVLKVPSIEQKVLDATSNEPWGPHGTVLADIAQASRNYHEYQIIMAVIWKRINDTGKNWRHVYKALTVLEYMVANGSERVIDDIREHAYQIQTLSDFQYIDSNGRDQGNNVRKKSQSLVVLVNDKERIVEVRQKAAANREKYRGSNSSSMHRPGSGGYEDERYDGHYGSRDEDRNGHARERESGYRDDDRYGREYEDRYSRDGYKDDDYRGRSRSVDGHQYGSRSRSSERDRDRAYEDDGQYTSSNLEKRLDRKFSEQNIEAPPSYEEAVGAARSPTYSEQGGEIPSASAPMSYSSAATASPSQATHGSASQPAFASPSATSPPPPPVSDQKEPDSFDEFDPRGSFSAAPVASGISSQNASSPGEMDLLGSLSESFSANSLALVPADSATSALGTEAFGESAFVGTSSSSTFDDPFGDGPFKAIPSVDQLPAQNQNSISTSSYPAVSGQSHEPPQIVLHRQETENNWGDAFPGAIFSPSSASGIQASVSNVQYSHQELSAPNHGIDILADILPPAASQSVESSQTSFLPQSREPSLQTGFPLQNNQIASQTGNPSQNGQIIPHTGFPEGVVESFPVQPGQPFLPEGLHSGHVSQPNVYTQNTTPTSFTASVSQESHMGFSSQSGQPVSVTGSSFQMGSSQHASFQDPSMQQNVPISGSYRPQLRSTGSVSPGRHAQQAGSMGFFSQSSSVSSAPSQIIPFSQAQSNAGVVSQPMVPASTGSLTSASRPAEDKFKTKSTVWTDTLNRGLVNLNISGPKTNPLSDIGVDFDAINRKDKRMEKPSTAPAVSNVTMGRAMGSGSGLGRSGAGVLRPASNPMMGSGMGMGMGMGMGPGVGGGPRPGIGMGGYGAVNQPMGVGSGMNMQQQPMMGMGMNMQQQQPMMGMGMNMQQQPMGMGMNMQQQPMGMGMNFGNGHGGQMQQPMGFPPGANTPGGYNSMLGTGNYGQQPYRGGYR